jgi:L-rhamnose mutarotase
MRFFVVFALLCGISAHAQKLPFAPEKLHVILPSPSEDSGMFSVFLVVLGLLDSYEKDSCAGISINFQDKGLYFDSAKGLNWWNSFFLPIHLGESARVRTASHRMIHRYHKKGMQMSRQKGRDLIEKYIQIRPEIVAKIADFLHKNFTADFMIGVHYRGTDKKREAPRVSYETVFASIRDVIKKSGAQNYKIFVATDEQQFLTEIESEFEGNVVAIDATRSQDGKAVHFSQKNRYEMGEQALMDCLLLSKTDFLVRTASNLSYCSLLFNPRLSSLLVVGR